MLRNQRHVSHRTSTRLLHKRDKMRRQKEHEEREPELQVPEKRKSRKGRIR